MQCSSTKQLDHKCAQNERVQLYMQPGAGKPIMYRVWLPAECIACALSVLSIHSPDYVVTVLVSTFMKTHNHF